MHSKIHLHLRYIELTEEDKEKLKGSYKVAKKLEKLENRDKNGDSDEDDDFDCDTGGDYPSLDSFSSNISDPHPVSPESSMSPRTLTGGVSSPAVGQPGGGQLTPRSTASPSVTTGSGPVSLAESMAMVDDILANGTMDRMDRIEKLESLLTAATNLASPSPQPKPTMVDSETQVDGRKYFFVTIKNVLSFQTLSTGDIVITKVYFPEGQQQGSQVCCLFVRK